MKLAITTLLLTTTAFAQKPKPPCHAVLLEATVKAGESYEKPFAKGFVFYLEPLASGWIVRVLEEGKPRTAHDFAELATPPYKSPNPLLISTDFAFRAQDAISWNPRRFRYAGSAAAFQQLAADYDKVLANDTAAMSRVAQVTEHQPAAELQILNAVLTPGTADQWKMAAAVATHFEQTPHQVEPGARPTPLGRLAELHFRVRLSLPENTAPAPGASIISIPCVAKPTT